MATFGLWVMGVLGQLFRAFVVTRIWSWYVVSFFDVRPLSFVYAFALLLAVNVIMPSRGLAADVESWAKKTDGEKGVQSIVVGLVSPAIALLLAWLGTFFT